MKLIITSGFYEPVHPGHIECFRLARQLGDLLVVIVNNDEQAKRKKGFVFQPLADRIEIIKSIRYVDYAIASESEDQSVCSDIERVCNLWPIRAGDKVIFAKGGDRTSDEIPEKAVCDRLGIEIIDGLGAKIRSSSEIIKRRKDNK